MTGNEIRAIFAKNIKALRGTRNLSQADLAFAADISIPFLSDIERGNKWPSPETTAKIANALDADLYMLFLENDGRGTKRSAFLKKMVSEIGVAQKRVLDEIYEKYAK